MFNNHRDKSKDLRFSNHNTLSIKENLKEGRKKNGIESRMTKGSQPRDWYTYAG
jgi:hypothetical protein